MVNLTLEVIIIFTASLITFISSALYYRQYKKSPDLLIGSMALAWLFYGATQLAIVIGLFLLNSEIYKWNPLLFGCCAITAQIAFDLIEKGKIIYWHIGGISTIFGGLIITTFFLNEVESIVLANNTESLLVTGVTRNLIILLAFLVVIQNFAYAFKIYRNAHNEFTNLKRNILIGNFLFGPGAFIAYALQPYILIPGIIDLLIAIGLLISTTSILKAPQLLFVLPFKAIQLSVIEAGSGTNIFSYHWSKSEGLVPDAMLTAVIEAINMFVTENVNLGIVNEISLKEGKIILTQISGTNKYIALIATNTSLSLRIGIEKFSKALFTKFEKELMTEHLRVVTGFSKASELILDCFPYTPKHQY